MYHTNAENVIYPNHTRTPNVVVRGLYSVGFFIADFGPMFVNLFNAIYITARKLFAFLIGLLIELSTVIILIGTIAFSVYHSLELLRRGGAVGGMEYVGVIMFEIVFISSVATMTRSLMKGERPDGYSFIGFVLGFLFVEWSNITGMAQNWTGWIIGFFTPILLIIAEGILAYQFLSDKEKKRTRDINRIMKKHSKLTPADLEKAIAMYQEQTKTAAEKTLHSHNEWKKFLLEEKNENGIKLVEKLAPKMVLENKESQASSLPEPETAQELKKDDPQQPNPVSTVADGNEKKIARPGKQEEYTTNTENEKKTGQVTAPAINRSFGENRAGNGARQESSRKETASNDQGHPETEDMRKHAKMWAMKFYQETGKIPGRVRIANHTHCKDRIAREVAEEMKKKYGEVS